MLINQVSLPEFEVCTDKYGMMTDNLQGNSTGNGNLFTAHYVFGLFSNGTLEVEKERLKQVFLNNFSESGLLCRTPGFPGMPQAQDDLFGLMGAEAMLFPEPQDRLMTKAIYEYGQGNCDGLASDASPKDQTVFKWLKVLTFGSKWVWNNVNPRKFTLNAWLGRFPNLIATMEMAQRKTINPLKWFWWAATMMALPLKMTDINYRDGYTLRFHSAIACEGYGPLTNWVCKQVRNAIARDYGDMGWLLGQYFANPSHPIVKLCKGKF